MTIRRISKDEKNKRKMIKAIVRAELGPWPIQLKVSVVVALVISLISLVGTILAEQLLR